VKKKCGTDKFNLTTCSPKQWKYDIDRKDGVTKLDWEQYFDQRRKEYYKEMGPPPEEHRKKK